MLYWYTEDYLCFPEVVTNGKSPLTDRPDCLPKQGWWLNVPHSLAVVCWHGYWAWFYFIVCCSSGVQLNVSPHISRNWDFIFFLFFFVLIFLEIILLCCFMCFSNNTKYYQGYMYLLSLLWNKYIYGMHFCVQVKIKYIL